MDKLQKIGVSGFIYDNRKVLILRRSRKEKFMPGYYDLPGGKVEFGESLENALAREIKEETNLIIEIIRPYSSFSYITSKNTKHTIDIQFLAKTKNIRKLKISNAHDDYEWIKENEINNYKVSAEMKKSIKEGFKELKKIII